MSVKIALVVAVADNGIIGRGNALPWHIGEDLRRFREITLGHPVIMGRRTFESIGRALPGRRNIVLSSSGRVYPDTVPAANFSEALAEVARGADEGETAMVIGGADVFAVALPLAGRIYLTEVHANVEGDVRFPHYARGEWRETDREDRPASDGVPSYSFVILDRIPAR